MAPPGENSQTKKFRVLHKTCRRIAPVDLGRSMKCPKFSFIARKFHGEIRKPIRRMRQYGMRGCRITAESRTCLSRKCQRHSARLSKKPRATGKGIQRSECSGPGGNSETT